MRELKRYIAAGLLNTAIGYGVFLIAWHYFALNPQMANAIGYAIALCAAFLLNHFFVFSGKARSSTQALLRFIIAFVIAFSLNQLVLMALLRCPVFPTEISQLIAMTFYTLLFYCLNKYFAFKAMS